MTVDSREWLREKMRLGLHDVDNWLASDAFARFVDAKLAEQGVDAGALNDAGLWYEAAHVVLRDETLKLVLNGRTCLRDRVAGVPLHADVFLVPELERIEVHATASTYPLVVFKLRRGEALDWASARDASAWCEHTRREVEDAHRRWQEEQASEVTMR